MVSIVLFIAPISHQLLRRRRYLYSYRPPQMQAVIMAKTVHLLLEQGTG